MALLDVKNLSIAFGGLKAVDQLNFTVNEGEIYGLIGPNGAGKTTVFNCISRFYTPDEGSVLFESKKGSIDVTHLPVHKVIDTGLVRTFQNVELIKGLTIMDNLLIGMHHNMSGNLITNILGLGRKSEVAFRQRASEVLEFLGLAGMEHEIAGAQSYGTQKLIELGRTLMSEPTLIILDEPAAGMNHVETEKLASLIKRIRDDLKITILLVEHDMNLVMDICDRLCVISFGKKIAEGVPDAIKVNKDVQAAYLGGSDD